MTSRSCDMVYHAQKGESFFEYPEGHFYWRVDEDGSRWLWMKLPALDGDPDGAACMIPMNPQKNDVGAGWDWDGNVEKPTLTPSVFCDPKQPSSRFHWHGWITAGRMVGC